MKVQTLELPERLKPLFNDPDRNQVIVAHRRWAKTLYCVAKCIFGTDTHAGALNKPDSTYWIVLPTYRQAKLAAWKMLKKMAKQTGMVAKVNDSELFVRFVNDSEVHLKGSDVPDSLRGGGLDGCCLDEWALQLPNIYTEILRPALADKHGWSVKTFTPKGKNHAYNDFERSSKKYYFPADQTDVIDPKELEEMKAEMSEDEFNQEMMCQFLYYAGQIYTEFKRDIHVSYNQTSYPAEWKRILGIDYGLKNPTCILFGVIDDNGVLCIHDEIYENGREVSYFADAINSREKDYEAFIDPSTQRNDRIKNGVEYSIYQEFAEHGVCVTPANNSVRAGINKVKQMLLQRKLLIHKRCENLIRELEMYRWKEHKNVDVNDPEEPMKVNDHACDALRYMCATHFSASEKPKPKQIFRSMDYFDKLYDIQIKPKYPSWALNN